MIKQNAYCQLMRLDKPVGIWLLLLPSLWGVWSALPYVSVPILIDHLIYYSILFLIGAVVMRSAGCVINDFFDRSFDSKVARTRNRPLVNGSIKPYQAVILFIILSVIGLSILVQLPKHAIWIGCISIIPVITYPLMKRVTYLPQFFLGLTYNIGILIGYVTITNVFHPHILWLYASGVLLTVAYDTIYAFQDIKDDLQIGVKSTAILWQKNPKIWITICYTISFSLFALFLNNLIINVSLGIILLYILYQIHKWDITDNINTLYFFNINVYISIILLALIMINSF